MREGKRLRRRGAPVAIEYALGDPELRVQTAGGEREDSEEEDRAADRS
jgi:3'-phosphoadenosine 5'-phosphosulfate sulfotransferase